MERLEIITLKVSIEVLSIIIVITLALEETVASLSQNLYVLKTFSKSAM